MTIYIVTDPDGIEEGVYTDPIAATRLAGILTEARRTPHTVEEVEL